MLVSEFIDRTGYQPSADEYADIEQAYYMFDGDKDAFCRAWIRLNRHKAGTLWNAIKEQERQRKVFDSLVYQIVRKRVVYTDIVAMETWCPKSRNEWMNKLTTTIAATDRAELKTMLEKLYNSVIWHNARESNKNLLFLIYGWL